MAKIILFEGPDNNFKSSLINEIVNSHNIQNYVIIHSGKPETHGLTKEQIVLNQLDYNYNLIRNAERISDKFDMIFLDRSYIGEYVYGQMYRDIAYKEKHLTDLEQSIFRPEIWTSVLLLDSVENRLEREDGKSLSTSEHTMQYETMLFKKFFSASTLQNKHIIDWSQTDYFNDENRKNIIDNILKN